MRLHPTEAQFFERNGVNSFAEGKLLSINIMNEFSLSKTMTQDLSKTMPETINATQRWIDYESGVVSPGDKSPAFAATSDKQQFGLLRS